MFDYLDRFKQLSPELKEVVSSPEALEKISVLEKKYQVDLAPMIMRIIVKDLNFKNLSLILGLDLGLEEDQALSLVEDLKAEIFSSILPYLGLVSEVEESEPEISPYNQKVNFWAKEIIRILQFKFNNSEKEAAFIDLLEKYLRGVKGRYDVRETLLINQDSGGFGLTNKMIDNIFMIIQEVLEKDKEELKSSFQVESGVLNKIGQLKHGLIAPKEELLMISPEEDVFHLPSPRRELDEESFSLPIISSKEEEEKEEVEEEPKEVQAKVSTPVSPITPSGKVPMTDVKRVKITGPIDEIRYLDLVNFRRLSSDPQEALKKVAQKLKVLEGIDYGKMIEGIKAWRQSPVNRLYLKMFFKASNESLSLDEVIEHFRNNNDDYLTREELDTIIKFNRELTF